MNASQIKKKLQEKGNPNKATILSGFFKTGKGQYGEGDVFLGVTVPEQRIIAKQVEHIAYHELSILLHDRIHECRLVALLICVHLYEKEKKIAQQQQCVNFYLQHTHRINNWDLVDLSAYKLLGHWAYHQKQEQLLKSLAQSGFLWEERIAMVACLYLIKKDSYETAFQIADQLLMHPHDLIQKAVGWMLREIGKRDILSEKAFLHPRYKKMPRTMLRYAIEKFPETERKQYLHGLI